MFLTPKITVKTAHWMLVRLLAIVVGLWLLFNAFAQAQETATPGAACTGTRSTFWEQSGICVSSVWQRPAFQFGASTSQTCNTALAGMLQWTGTAASPNNTLEYCNGSSWTTFAAANSGLLLGSSATASPQRSGDVTTGLFSAVASSVSIETAGAEVIRIVVVY